MYSLNNIPLASFGFIPGKHDNSNLALSGFMDMPSRLGKTFHDWANESGVEPYVSASEIFFGGRDLSLIGFIEGIDRDDCEYKRASLVSFLDSLTDLVPLTSTWGTQNVKINGPVLGGYLGTRLLSLSIPMREPKPDLSGILPVANDSEFGIDHISFKNLGGVALELSGDRRNRPAPKGEQFTVYGTEGYSITKTVAPELNLRIYIKQPSYAEFKTKISGLYKLFSSPGMRNLTMKNDHIRSFFVKDGFKVTKIYSKPNYFMGIVEVKITQSGIPGTLTNLIDSLGNLITYQGNTIQIRIV